jgi:hypothetical protein
LCFYFLAQQPGNPDNQNNDSNGSYSNNSQPRPSFAFPRSWKPPFLLGNKTVLEGNSVDTMRIVAELVIVPIDGLSTRALIADVSNGSYSNNSQPRPSFAFPRSWKPPFLLGNKSTTPGKPFAVQFSRGTASTRCVSLPNSSLYLLMGSVLERLSPITPTTHNLVLRSHSLAHGSHLFF